MRASAILRWAVRAAAVALAVFGIYRLWWVPLHADHVLVEMDTDTGRIVELPDDQRVQGARDHLETLAKIEPYSIQRVDYYMISAANERIANNPAQAVADYSRALEFDHRPELYYWRGRTLFEMGKVEEAIPDLRAAVRYNKYLIYQIPPEVRDRIQSGPLPELPRFPSAQ